MILVNSTNTNSGTWIPFNVYPTVDLGTGGDGLRTVNFYFQGLGGMISRVTKRIWLDTTPPILTITAPGSNTLNQPVLQLQGYANEDLYSISYDLNNANGSVSNQHGLLTGAIFDTNSFAYDQRFLSSASIWCWPAGQQHGYACTPCDWPATRRRATSSSTWIIRARPRAGAHPLLAHERHANQRNQLHLARHGGRPDRDPFGASHRQQRRCQRGGRA